jgi:MazG family protein
MSEEGVGARFERFVELVRRLRAPGGCPWDREQTHVSLKPMTIEEAYEVIEAIDLGDDHDLAGELGDLMLQAVFHSQIATEEQRFDVGKVLDLVCEKLVRRHPHVFGDATAETSAEALRNWEALKADERRAQGKAPAASSMLDSVSKGLPATMEAFQISTKASRVGFDWPDAPPVLEKLREELTELEQAAETGDAARIQDELGDLLFAAVNLGRILGNDAEGALKAANRKFRRRFAYIEERLRAQGRGPAESTLPEMDALWNEAKALERAKPAVG